MCPAPDTQGSAIILHTQRARRTHGGTVPRRCEQSETGVLNSPQFLPFVSYVKIMRILSVRTAKCSGDGGVAPACDLVTAVRSQVVLQTTLRSGCSRTTPRAGPGVANGSQCSMWPGPAGETAPAWRRVSRSGTQPSARRVADVVLPQHVQSQPTAECHEGTQRT